MEEEKIINLLMEIKGDVGSIKGELNYMKQLSEIGDASLRKDIQKLDGRLSDVEAKVEVLDKKAGTVALKWLGLIGGGILTILLGFIAVKLGLK